MYSPDNDDHPRFNRSNCHTISKERIDREFSLEVSYDKELLIRLTFSEHGIWEVDTKNEEKARDVVPLPTNVAKETGQVMQSAKGI